VKLTLKQIVAIFKLPIADAASEPEASQQVSSSHSYWALTSLEPRRFGLFTSLSARGKAREGEKRKIRREAPDRIRIQNGGSVFCKCSVLLILLLKCHCLQQNTGSYIAITLKSSIFNLNF
jgi:hypothetical protein